MLKCISNIIEQIEESHIINERMLKHLLPEDAIVDSLLKSNTQELKHSSFFSAESAEKIIKEALSNSIMQKRIEKWMTSNKYIKQERMIVSFPSDLPVGYVYCLNGKNITYTECKYVCLVFKKSNGSFNLHTAYPDFENVFLMI